MISLSQSAGIKDGPTVKKKKKKDEEMEPRIDEEEFFDS